MADIAKPDTLNLMWAEVGNKIKPEDSKIQRGWVEEIPPLEYFNYMDNRRDKAIAHINQHGIAVWDALTEYLEGKSYVQGSDGVIYKCIATNFGNDPVTSGSFWTEAFVSVNSADALQTFIGYEVRGANFTAVPNTRYYLTSPLIVNLPLTAKIGQVVTLVKKPTITTTVRVSSGVITTAGGSDSSVSFDLDDEVNFVFNGTNWEV